MKKNTKRETVVKTKSSETLIGFGKILVRIFLFAMGFSVYCRQLNHNFSSLFSHSFSFHSVVPGALCTCIECVCVFVLAFSNFLSVAHAPRRWEVEVYFSRVHLPLHFVVVLIFYFISFCYFLFTCSIYYFLLFAISVARRRRFFHFY